MFKKMSSPRKDAVMKRSNLAGKCSRASGCGRIADEKSSQSVGKDESLKLAATEERRFDLQSPKGSSSHNIPIESSI